MVEEIALQSNSLRAPTCVAEMQETTDAVAAARALDPLYRQALSSATRSYCTLR
jgi:chorismate mutase